MIFVLSLRYKTARRCLRSQGSKKKSAIDGINELPKNIDVINSYILLFREVK